MGELISKLKVTAIVSGAALFVAACGQPTQTEETTTTTTTTETVLPADAPAVDEALPADVVAPVDEAATVPAPDVTTESTTVTTEQ